MTVTLFSHLKFEFYCEYYPEILQQVSFKSESKIDGRGHQIFSKKLTNPWKIQGYATNSELQMFFGKICKTLPPSSPPTYLMYAPLYSI